uniref:Uncharacterized protein n=1 Tax=Arundo donax TaxID=35708 RepID=A0A0A9TWS2_ARUDO
MAKRCLQVLGIVGLGFNFFFVKVGLERY